MITLQQFQDILENLERTEQGCKIWPFKLTHKGYPDVRIGGIRKGNRVALTLKLARPIKENFMALHTCDNRACVAFEHLYEGTDKDNKTDMVTRKRAARGLQNGVYTRPDRRATGERNGARLYPERLNPPRGERQGRHKLKETDVIEIRKLYGVFEQNALAKMFGVSQQNISRVCNRVTWRHVP